MGKLRTKVRCRDRFSTIHEEARRVTRHRPVKIFVLATIIYSSNANRTARLANTFENQSLIDEQPYRSIGKKLLRADSCREIKEQKTVRSCRRRGEADKGWWIGYERRKWQEKRVVHGQT